MTNTVTVSENFKKEAESLKFYTLKESIDSTISDLIKDPFCGDPHGLKIYKVRIKDKSKSRGKSGGFRVLYCHISKTDEGITILLMSIFDKSDKATITKADAVKKLNDILKDL
jgi:mRNA-degrading endonuclease RelE of RelBE toxin-antitoxin system